jgi:hypothetical protein
MADFFTAPFAGGVSSKPVDVLIRLLVALALGVVVGWLYRRTIRGSSNGSSLPTTLVLLCVLIAMVTQVIGDSVARAFSLVGALSIVRFRTVVRDTRDTAYVIFAVVVGMAAGALNLWVAGIGIVVVGAAAFMMAGRFKGPDAADPPFLLRVRAGLGHDLERLAGAPMDAHLAGRHLLAVSTAKQGTALEYVYETRLRQGGSAEEMVKLLNLIEGVQDVQWQLRGFEQD